MRLNRIETNICYRPGHWHNAIDTNIACTATFGCTCWAPDDARDEHGRYSHDCGGTINFAATHCPQLGDNMHQVHVSFVHTAMHVNDSQMDASH